ncbi:predicted membrane protein [Firmicutes bacterium CAG:341]|uniref:GtrA family protein n=1 Tax=Eubacterium sp. TaxID=142586 RepID=UPI00033A2E95|nr:predicted membrane protein [Firmicutes bacterium CAG:341]
MESISANIPKTNKFINGETVSYTLMATVSLFILFSIKQILKVFIGIGVAPSCIIAFLIASIVSFIIERKYVFGKKILSSNIKQIIFFVIRIAVNFGFYKLAEFGFFNMLDMPISFAWFIAIVTSFLFNYVYDRTLIFDCGYDAVSVRQSKTYKIFYKNRYVFLTTVLATACIAVIYVIFSVFPFGSITVMRMDLYHQYGPLFAELYDRIVEHKSLLYSWNTGGGSSFLGNYLNYLSSPLSFLIFLFDKEDISYAITFIVAFKCILSATSFSYYLKKSFNKDNYFLSVFGILYAFSAYFLAYYWNVMWLDAMIMLPLIALGIEKIFKTGDIKLYTASLVILFFANYYMGYMCCIFAVLYFFVCFINTYSNDGKLNENAVYKKKYSTKALMNNVFINRGVKFAFASIIAALICAITLVPVFMILKNSSATSGTFPQTFKSYFDLLDLITSHFALLETTIRSSGDNVLPNIYTGILTFILLPLFLVNNKIKLKEKATYVVLIIFFVFCFNNNCAEYIWHAFHFPNDLPYRYSYMYSFIIAVMGYKTILNFKGIKVKDIAYTGLAIISFVIICQKFLTNKMTNSTIYATIIFVALWCGFLFLLKNKNAQKKTVSFVLVTFILCETIISSIVGLPLNQDNKNYKENYKTYTDAINYIDNKDSGFYRTELCYLNTRMDPAYYGYNGISVFSSMAYESYSQLQSSLGMQSNKVNSYTYNTQTPVYNMMFNIKYLIQTDVSLAPSSNLYKKIYTTSDKKSNVYESKYNLPIAYCVNSKIDDWVTDEGNPFEIQSDFVKLATGYSNLFKPVEYNSTDFDAVSGDDVTENGTYWLEKSDSSSNYGTETVSLSPTIDGNLYLYVKSSDLKTITVNSEKVSDITQSMEDAYILDLGYHNKGDEVLVSLDASKMESESTSFDFYCYTADDTVVKNMYNSLAGNSLNVESYSDTTIKGTVNAKENCYLYSSIPYDDGWSVYVDGKKAETFEIGGTLLAIELTPGQHKIEYKYFPVGFLYGIIISAVTVFGLCVFYIYNKSSLKLNKSKRRKDKIIVE